MPDRRLRAVSRTQGNNRALKDGTVRLAHYELDFEEVPVLPQAFRRMVRGLEFDVCEMAVTTYLVAKAHGKAFTALPVFLVRGFHHGAILTRATGGIQDPKDLEGRSVGVNRGYTVTTGLWARAVLREEYGVDLDRITWVLSGDEHVTEYRPPANVVSMPPGNTLADLVKTGELAAAIGIEANDLVPLLKDDGYASLTRTGWYPINHLVVVRDALLAEHDDLAEAVFDGFAEAKERYVAQLRRGAIAEPTATDRMHRRVMELTGVDPLPYGLDANRAALDALVGHALDQHILDEQPNLNALFA
jgi:4,5-dihydroxyphthalate decarboxylase